jgi:hypothetical protein
MKNQIRYNVKNELNETKDKTVETANYPRFYLSYLTYFSHKMMKHTLKFIFLYILFCIIYIYGYSVNANFFVLQVVTVKYSALKQ